VHKQNTRVEDRLEANHNRRGIREEIKKKGYDIPHVGFHNQKLERTRAPVRKSNLHWTSDENYQQNLQESRKSANISPETKAWRDGKATSDTMSRLLAKIQSKHDSPKGMIDEIHKMHISDADLDSNDGDFAKKHDKLVAKKDERYTAIIKDIVKYLKLKPEERKKYIKDALLSSVYALYPPENYPENY